MYETPNEVFFFNGVNCCTYYLNPAILLELGACTNTWGDLKELSDDGVKYCDEYKTNVHKATNMEDLVQNTKTEKSERI
ncbi:MAG: hypothetical protein SCARUB_04953 [Candidatus Scalindua rubra]|uniref:Uncharacterized protein n=1 Tax=Candidatus Scalindua rubra TaxID=1872076 RepID=A0A1E3X2T5_9BACT|nr:MAG: hypothetical protein SCARUB_04953 [Candidatus Scalindua rubra]